MSALGPLDPSFRSLFGRFEFTVRRHKCNRDSLSLGACRWRSGLDGGIGVERREIERGGGWVRGEREQRLLSPFVLHVPTKRAI